jgi:RNA polymerase sigma factor (sigma-70 family)
MHVPMTAKADSLRPTRRSLINRLRNCEDQESWREFFKTYWKLIYSFAIRCGCTDAEAEEVVQETVISLARKMPEYRYEPEICSFKGWLMHLTNWRVIDQLRKRRPGNAAPLAIDSATIKLVDELASPRASELESLWDEEWQKNLIDAAMERVKRKVNAEYYQIFHLLLIKHQSPRKVASLLKINVARVYLAKHRVAALVQKEIKLLTKKLL